MLLRAASRFPGSLGKASPAKVLPFGSKRFCAILKTDPSIRPPPPLADSTAPSRHKEREIFELQVRDYEKKYPELRKEIKENAPHIPNHKEIYAVSTISLANIDYYGFDYDYTLVAYTPEVELLIYNLARNALVEKRGYPEDVLNLQYDPNFAVRGLHYDKQTGYLLKINSLNNIQTDTVHFGLRAVPEEEQLWSYGVLKIREPYMQQHMKLMSDIFSVPEACLIAHIIQYMSDNKLPFHPSYIHDDISAVLDVIHTSGELHETIISDLGRYMKKQPRLADWLLKLRDAGKRLFMLSNNAWRYIDAGMEYLIGDSLPAGTKWPQLFDAVMTQCRKPHFFKYSHPEPFRALHVDKPRKGSALWQPVSAFEPGTISTGGSLIEMNRLTGWDGSRVLYFGDHLDNDLVEPSRLEGWRTGVILNEMAKEIIIQSAADYRRTLAQLLAVERLLRGAYFSSNRPVSKENITRLRADRTRLRLELKALFNKQFGSVFRTHTNSTLFAYNIQRYCDVYTSSVENFLEYPMDYTFYPERIHLPHEFHLGKFLAPDYVDEK